MQSEQTLKYLVIQSVTSEEGTSWVGNLPVTRHILREARGQDSSIEMLPGLTHLWGLRGVLRSTHTQMKGHGPCACLWRWLRCCFELWDFYPLASKIIFVQCNCWVLVLLFSFPRLRFSSTGNRHAPLLSAFPLSTPFPKSHHARCAVKPYA